MALAEITFVILYPKIYINVTEFLLVFLLFFKNYLMKTRFADIRVIKNTYFRITVLSETFHLNINSPRFLISYLSPRNSLI